MDRHDEFLYKLGHLLKEYNMCIGFACSPGSDTYGLYGERIVIDTVDNDTDDRVFDTENSWWLYGEDLLRIQEKE